MDLKLYRFTVNTWERNILKFQRNRSSNSKAKAGHNLTENTSFLENMTAAKLTSKIHYKFISNPNDMKSVLKWHFGSLVLHIKGIGIKSNIWAIKTDRNSRGFTENSGNISKYRPNFEKLLSIRFSVKSAENFQINS